MFIRVDLKAYYIISIDITIKTVAERNEFNRRLNYVYRKFFGWARGNRLFY